MESLPIASKWPGHYRQEPCATEDTPAGNAGNITEFDIVTTPTPIRHRAFELIGVPLVT